MKINQKTPQFEPITIALETHDEAIAFIEMIHMLENFRVNEGENITPQSFNKKQTQLIIDISNTFTLQDITI